MLKIKDSFFLPSEKLIQPTHNEFFILDLDGFFYERVLDLDETKVLELVLFNDPNYSNRDCWLFRIPELGLVESYKILEKIEDSSCFNYSYFSTFTYDEFKSADYMVVNFNIDFNELLKKLKIINED